MFTIDKGKGFSVRLVSGITIRTMFGRNNFCDFPSEEGGIHSADTSEVSIFDSNGNNITEEMLLDLFPDDRVLSPLTRPYTEPDQWGSIIEWAMYRERKEV